jgi:hypothetical protein
MLAQYPHRYAVFLAAVSSECPFLGGHNNTLIIKHATPQ